MLHKASNGCSLVLIRADEEIKFTSVLWRFFVPKKKVHNVFFVTIELGSCHFYIVACTAPMRTATPTYRDERANGDGDRWRVQSKILFFFRLFLCFGPSRGLAPKRRSICWGASRICQFWIATSIDGSDGRDLFKMSNDSSVTKLFSLLAPSACFWDI